STDTPGEHGVLSRRHTGLSRGTRVDMGASATGYADSRGNHRGTVGRVRADGADLAVALTARRAGVVDSAAGVTVDFGDTDGVDAVSHRETRGSEARESPDWNDDAEE